VALGLADRYGAEIISVDSMQVYREMDIGTAKPSRADRQRVPHHLIDVVDPEHEFTVADFQAGARNCLVAARERGVPVVIAGGSGLHFRAIVDPLEFPPTDVERRNELDALPAAETRGMLLAADPDAGDHVDLDNPRRVVRALVVYELTGATPSDRAVLPEARAVKEYTPRFPFHAIGLDPGDGLAPRTAARFDRMLTAGLLDEVAALAPRLGPTARQAVGYKELLPVAQGIRSLAAGREDALRATTALAKRQRVFFRRDPRLRWLSWHDDPKRRLGDAAAVLEEAGAWNS
jgi:tRNA dimethylallyltransferase